MTEEERAWEGELRLRARGILTHHQHRKGAIAVPPDTKDPIGVVRAYRDEKRAISPYRQVKKQMMREGGLSSRQWRHFRKQMNRQAKREMMGDGGFRE